MFARVFYYGKKTITDTDDDGVLVGVCPFKTITKKELSVIGGGGRKMIKIYKKVISKKFGLYILPALLYLPGLLFTTLWGMAIATSFPNALILGRLIIVLPQSLVLMLLHMPFNRMVLKGYEEEYGIQSESKRIFIFLNLISLLQGALTVSLIFLVVHY